MSQNGLHNAGDLTLAGVAASSPAWAPWLQDFNDVLTAATLILGIILAAARLCVIYKQWRASYNKASK